MSACKTYTIIVDKQTGDRIEYEYDRSDSAWNIYAIDGQTGYPIHSSYAGSKAERDIIIRDEAPAWFEDEDERNAARAAYEMFGKADNDDAEAAAATALQDAARSLVNAYAEAIGEEPTEDDPETRAAYRVARANMGYTTATPEDLATVAAMVEAIAERWTQDHEPRDLFAEPAEYEAEAEAFATAAPAPTYQRYELEAFLGEPDDYDTDAIEAEAAAYDPKTSRTVWTPEAVRDLWTICERHELYSYSPAEDEPEPDEITAYMRRQAFGDYSRADATTREEMEAAALKFAAQEQTRLTTVWQEAGARQARERYEADEATARDLIILQDAGAITAEDVANYYRRHGWTPRKYERR